jgi:hypothetical protein
VLICATDSHILDILAFLAHLKSITYVFSIAGGVRIPLSPPVLKIANEYAGSVSLLLLFTGSCYYKS